jgi:hypothetical protein
MQFYLLEAAISWNKQLGYFVWFWGYLAQKKENMLASVLRSNTMRVVFVESLWQQ